MGNIRILPDNVINKIAAGEVVERPASVIKELVENSLDAGAQSITVTVKHGGKELVRVTDDGEGMSGDDVHQALKRHATSKITTVEDIFQIQSFGFRGEALPSIAAVSRLTLLTRKKSDAAGTELCVEGGDVQSVKETGTAPGTTVEARHLFFNTPARKKFLRSDRGEYLAIIDTMTTFALGNPAVHFKLTHDAKKPLDYPACANLHERIGQLFDEEIVEALVSLDERTPEINISGFVSNAAVSRVNRTGQYFFINNRPIKSAALSFALQRGYDGMLPPKRHGLAFLFLDIALPRVDVNVHPNKKEVRVAHERDVQKLVIDVVRAALHAHQPFVPPGQPLLENVHPLKRLPEGATGSRGYGPPTPSTFGLREPTVEFDRLEKTWGTQASATMQDLPLFEGAIVSPPRVIGQYQATYLVAEYDDKLLLIDQHSAHERIVYEKLLDQLGTGSSPSQRELIPITFSLDYREQEVLEACLPELERLGFGINSLGRNTYSIDAVPTMFAAEGSKELIFDIVHEMMEWQHSRAVEDKRTALAAAIACKQKTVKAAVRLAPEAMNQLVSDLFKTKQPFQCPHGRPTCVKFTLDDLEKRFGRK